MPNVPIKSASGPNLSGRNGPGEKQTHQTALTKNPKSISLAEILLIGQIVLWSDIIGFIIIEDFGLIDIFMFPMTQFYFKYKGVKGVYDLIGNIAECVPGVGWLPIRTVMFGVTVFAANHPKAFVKGMNLATKVAPGGVVVQGMNRHFEKQNPDQSSSFGEVRRPDLSVIQGGESIKAGPDRVVNDLKDLKQSA